MHAKWKNPVLKLITDQNSLEFSTEKILGRNFYDRSPTAVARGLIGKRLVRRLDNGVILNGDIVEVEAYGGNQDPASHAYKGITARNSVMFGEAGHAYVYFTYGFHHCLNFVTGLKGEASAVLIRAIEPRKGINTMKKLRKTSLLTEIASGPGKLCQALDIDKRLNGIEITKSNSVIQVLDTDSSPKVRTSTRIGINRGTERKWRFYADSNDHVSKATRL